MIVDLRGPILSISDIRQKLWSEIKGELASSERLDSIFILCYRNDLE
jgi:hypothetical protein